jgi:hypothetical protein
MKLVVTLETNPCIGSTQSNDYELNSSFSLQPACESVEHALEKSPYQPSHV